MPEGNKNRTVIWIGGGEYWEKITVNVTKRFLTFYGSANDMPRLMYNGTALEYGTVDSATVAVESDYFMAANIVFVVSVLAFINIKHEFSSCSFFLTSVNII